MIFDWNNEKNDWLITTRNISFEQIIVAIENGQIIDIMENPSKNFPNQFMIIVNYNDYIYCVPTVVEGERYFLKTIYPSRKYTKKLKE